MRLSPDPAASRLWSALVFGSDLMEELDEKEMMILARHGGAVSPVTSYLAIEPGVRPSTEGIPLEGTGDRPRRNGRRHHRPRQPRDESVSGAGRSFDHVAWLRKALEPARKRCGYAGRPVTVAIETTIDEIVDIPALPADVPGDRACLREATLVRRAARRVQVRARQVDRAIRSLTVAPRADAQARPSTESVCCVSWARWASTPPRE